MNQNLSSFLHHILFYACIGAGSATAAELAARWQWAPGPALLPAFMGALFVLGVFFYWVWKWPAVRSYNFSALERCILAFFFATLTTTAAFAMGKLDWSTTVWWSLVTIAYLGAFGFICWKDVRRHRAAAGARSPNE